MQALGPTIKNILLFAFSRLSQPQDFTLSDRKHELSPKVVTILKTLLRKKKYLIQTIKISNARPQAQHRGYRLLVIYEM